MLAAIGVSIFHQVYGGHCFSCFNNPKNGMDVRVDGIIQLEAAALFFFDGVTGSVFDSVKAT